MKNNIVVAANGIKTDVLKRVVESSLSKTKLQSGSPSVDSLPSSPYLGGEVKLRIDNCGVTYATVAFETPRVSAGMYLTKIDSVYP